MTNDIGTQTDYYSDSALREKHATGKRISARGLVREAEYLIRVRPELRQQARMDASEMSNMVAGYTFCDALSVVIQREAYAPLNDIIL